MNKQQIKKRVEKMNPEETSEAKSYAHSFWRKQQKYSITKGWMKKWRKILNNWSKSI